MTRPDALIDAAMTVQRREIADIDATIALWKESGLRARDMGEQLGCAPRWPWIRQRMIVLTVPHGRTRPTNASLIALMGARKFRGLNQAAVASRVGCSRRAISAYEQGYRTPSAETLAAWRAALGLRVPARKAA